MDCIKLIHELVTCILHIKSALQIAMSCLKGHKEGRIREYNARMLEICQKEDWCFMKNCNINNSHLSSRDGIHLNMSGIKKLAQTYTIRYLQTFILRIVNGFQ